MVRRNRNNASIVDSASRARRGPPAPENRFMEDARPDADEEPPEVTLRCDTCGATVVVNSDALTLRSWPKCHGRAMRYVPS